MKFSIRLRLFRKVHFQIQDIGYCQLGRKPSQAECSRIKKHWIQFFGFKDLREMTKEDLVNFIGLLASRRRAVRRLRCFPELYSFIEAENKKDRMEG